MNKQRSQLISNLSQDLKAVQHPGKSLNLALVWFLLNFALVVLLTLATGPFRTGSLDQLQSHPQFLIESLAGLGAIGLLAAYAFKSGLPSSSSIIRLCVIPLLSLLIWLAFYVWGLWSPALPASMAGKREILCNITTLLVGLPGLVLGLFLIRRLWPLHGAWSGMLIGLAAGASSGLIMQFACMYAIDHIFMHHLLPGLLLGPVGLVLGKYFLTK